jgi:hypothetical protein
MEFPGNLKSAERRVFQATISDGLWDVFLGCFFLSFSIAPLLSTKLGDFWSSAIMIPICGLAILVIWYLRRNVIQPRIGTVVFGPERNRKLRRATSWLLALNILFFLAGIIIYLLGFTPTDPSGLAVLVPGIMGLIPWAMLSLTGYLLEYPRLYLYGALSLIAPMIGEWLYRAHGFPHHGIPFVYGILAFVMILTGIWLFVRLLHNNPPIEFDETDE